MKYILKRQGILTTPSLLSYIFSNEFKHFQKMTMTPSVEGNTMLSYLPFIFLFVLYFICSEVSQIFNTISVLLSFAFPLCVI